MRQIQINERNQFFKTHVSRKDHENDVRLQFREKFQMMNDERKAGINQSWVGTIAADLVTNRMLRTDLLVQKTI
jgi:hypothetical protein